ncbi:CBM9 family sugar-binding protein [bacterium]|nr:CBM9 family sugar-binding protein [bacterium]
MKFKTILTLSLCLVAPLAFGQVGDFTGETSIGDDGFLGTASFSGGVYTIEAGGTDVWDIADDFYWVYKEVSGSFSAQVSLEWSEDGAIRTNPVEDWRKAGIMLRVDPEDESSVNVFGLLRGDYGANLQWRPVAGDVSTETGLQGVGANDTNTIVLQRVLNTFSLLRVQTDGSLRSLGSTELDLPATLNIGLAVCSHNVDNIEVGKFSSFQIDEIPVAVNASRTLPSNLFTPGIAVNNIKVDITVEPGKTTDLVVKETVPEGWTLASSSPTGTQNGNTITWNMSGVSGSKTITYSLNSDPETPEGVLLSGTVEVGDQTFGVGGEVGMDLEGANAAVAPLITTNSVTLDGELSPGEYDGAYIFTFDRANAVAPGVLIAGDAYPKEESNLTVHIFHDDRYIYVGMDMVDPSVSFVSSAADAWQNDSVELYMDGDDSRQSGTKDGNNFGFQATVMGDGAIWGGIDPPLDADIVDLANGGVAVDVDGRYWNAGARPKDDGSGYIVEYKVDKDLILDPLTISEIGFDIGVNDVNEGDTARTGKWAWWHFDNATGGRVDAWDDESGWGRLTLLPTSEIPGVDDWGLY